MKTDKFWGLVFQKALNRLVSREFENRKIIVWLALGIIFFGVLLIIPGIDFWIEVLLSLLFPVIKIVGFFLYDIFCFIPQDIYKEKVDEISNLKERYITPDLTFNVLMMGEAFKNGERYASVVVVNNEEFPIETFMGIIVGVEIGYYSTNSVDLVNRVNPGGRPLMIDGEDRNFVTLLPYGGRARFNIAKNDGNEFFFLTDNDIRIIEYPDTIKVTIKFTGVANGKYITPIEKAYTLDCTYEDMEMEKGLLLVGFNKFNDL